MPSSAEIDLILNDRRFLGPLNRVRQTLIKLQDSFRAVARIARNFLLVGGGALAFFVKTASDFEETSSKFDAVFKDMSGSVNRWAEEQSKTLNRSKVDLLGYAAALQDTFVPMGFGREEAAELSKQLVKLGIDLSSFNNRAEPEVMQALTSALVGNHEAVRSFGISITAARLDTELLRLGFQKITKGATEQQKAIARLSLIISDSSDAQGDAERTSGSFENQIKGLRASFVDLSVAIGSSFIPALKTLITDSREVIDTMAKWVNSNRELTFAIGATAGAMGVMLFALPALVAAMKIYGVVAASSVTWFIAQRTAMLAMSETALMTSVSTGALHVAIGALAVATALAVVEVFRLQRVLDNAGKEVPPLSKALNEIFRQKRRFADAETLEQRVAALRRIVEAHKDAELAARNDTNVTFESHQQLFKAMQRYEDQLKEAEAALKSKREAEGADAQAIKEKKKEQDSLNKVVDKTIDTLQLEIQTYGLGARAKLLYKLAADGVTESQVAYIQTLVDELDVLDAISKEEKKSEKAKEKLATKVKQHTEALENEAVALLRSIRNEKERHQNTLNRVALLEKEGQLSKTEADLIRERIKLKEKEKALNFESLSSAVRRVQLAVFNDPKINPQRASVSTSPSSNTAVVTQKATQAIQVNTGKSRGFLEQIRDFMETLTESLPNMVGRYGG